MTSSLTLTIIFFPSWRRASQLKDLFEMNLKNNIMLGCCWVQHVYQKWGILFRSRRKIRGRIPTVYLAKRSNPGDGMIPVGVLFLEESVRNRFANKKKCGEKNTTAICCPGFKRVQQFRKDTGFDRASMNDDWGKGKGKY